MAPSALVSHQSSGHKVTGRSFSTSRAWWKEASIYQIYPASFCDSNGDGIGDIPGIITKLDYLKRLGVDVIWLCPVYKSPQVDMGYDIADYKSIHPPYGTVEDVDKLITGLRERGMKLVMDLVVNHTSDQHDWFKESRASIDNPKRDWYIWRKPRIDSVGNRYPPNNWASIFGGSAWTFDETTQEYYLHLFCREQPDLNWENPDVVDAVHEIMEFWLRRGVEGFRMDVINLISKEPGLPDAPVTVPKEVFQPAYALYANGPRLHEFLRGLRRVLDKYDAFAVGEMPWAKGTGDVVASVAEDRKELNMIFQFDIVDLDVGPEGKFSPKAWSIPELKSIVDKWQTQMQHHHGWNALFLENHDQSRSVSRFTPHRPQHRECAAKMLATFIGMQSGTLFVYQGQELGMRNLPQEWPIEEYKDIETQNFYKSALEKTAGDELGLGLFMDELHVKARDHARSPLQWTAEEHAGFSTSTPWMRINDDYLSCNAAQQISDADSTYSYWQKILRLRRQYADVLIYGRFEMLDHNHEAVVCFRRIGKVDRSTSDQDAAKSSVSGSTSDTVALIVANFTDEEQLWAVPGDVSGLLDGGKTVLSNYDERVGTVHSDKVLLRPFEAFVIFAE